MILRWYLIKPQDDPYRQDQEQPAKLVDKCQLVLVETPRMVYLDLAYPKISQLGKDFKGILLVIFAITDSGKLVNLDDK